MLSTGHDALAHLDLSLPPSPAIRAVAIAHQGLHPLTIIVQIDGYDSIASAARANLRRARKRALRQGLAKIEHIAGFKIFHRRTTPMTPTERGPRVPSRSHRDPPAPGASERTVVPPDRDRAPRTRTQRIFFEESSPTGHGAVTVQDAQFNPEESDEIIAEALQGSCAPYGATVGRLT